MEATTIDLSGVARSLGLDRQQGEVFFGRTRGFPVGFKVVNPLDNPLLLFHVRFPFAADAPEAKSVKYDGEVERLRAEKKLDVEIDDRMAKPSTPRLKL